MAKATKTVVEVEKVIKSTEDAITLELSRDEAEHLVTLLGKHVIGTGPRRTLNDVWYALRNLGVDYGRASNLGNGRVEFKDYPDDGEDRPIRVGDKVMALEIYAYEEYEGRTGVVTSIDLNHECLNYLLVLPGDETIYAKRVERVND